jgi:hypothetical protein
MPDLLERQIQQLFAPKRDAMLASPTNSFLGRVAVVLAREVDRLRAEVEAMKPKAKAKKTK